MLKKVAYGALMVRDQERALDFYVNVVGFEKRIDAPSSAGPRFVSIGVPGQEFELVLWPGTPASVQPGSAIYTIDVENCRAAYDLLASRGVKFQSDGVLSFPWGYIARFEDSDGNLLQVRELRTEFGS